VYCVQVPCSSTSTSISISIHREVKSFRYDLFIWMWLPWRDLFDNPRWTWTNKCNIFCPRKCRSIFRKVRILLWYIGNPYVWDRIN
jgi:hypothetical protein